MIYKPSESELSHTARAIGALFLNFSALEHTISLAVAAMLELTPKQEKPLVRGMMSRAKLDMLDAFAKAHWSKEDRQTLKDITDAARAVTDYRNDFAHGIISHDENGKWGVVCYRGQHRFVGIVKPFTPAELLLQSGEAERLALQFQALADAIDQREPTSPPLQIH